jgi:VIT1/CCC1 family predicted Fe2+/Mn2+ transporter
MRLLAFRESLIFGLCDGAMSILGVVFYAAGHTGLVFPIAVSGGVSAACSMAGGEYLSARDRGQSRRLGDAAAMGAATLAGSVLPAFPWLFLHGWQAPAAAVIAMAVVAAVVGRLRAGHRHPYTETVVVLLLVLAASALCALFIPGGAA